MKRNTHTYVKTMNGYKLYREYRIGDIYRSFGYYGKITYSAVFKNYRFIESAFVGSLKREDLDYASKIIKELEDRNDG